MATGKSRHLHGEGVTLEPKTACKLLVLLSTDGEFRRLFKKDIAAALSCIGHEILPGQVKNQQCLSVHKIAPKKKIAKACEILFDKLVGGTAQHPQTPGQLFEAATIAKALRRK